ncbi:MAG: Ig-like domain-containing domain, partial [Planctomycetota bacterium]
MLRTLFLCLLGALVVLPACAPSGNNIQIDPNGDPFNAGGSFFVEGSNILDGMFWQLNRPIQIEFNHPIDPDSVSFGTVLLRATDPQAAGTPVTGTFEIDASSGGRTLIFRPSCPTNEGNSNGAFVPGNIEYELILPTQTDSPTVLRDTSGRPLSSGLRRIFQTPALSQPLFLDLVPGPARVESVSFPSGLNLFADPDPVISILFNQAIDGRSSNLNTANITLRYSSGEVGTAGATNFAENNIVPGRLALVQNCTETGAEVEFRITGILPPNRNLELKMEAQFADLVGQVNTSQTVIGNHVTPTLGSIYDDPTWVETSDTVDEYRDDFDNSLGLALGEPIPLPLAQVSDGFIAANFDFPGSFVSEDSDFFIDAGITVEIFTDSESTFTDSNQREHTLQNGVLNVHDFRISAGSTLRGRGTNPLVIYATGEVVIDGTLDVSGNNGTWPTSLNSPQFVEGGANGECGGGRGGDASQIGNAETLRAMDGDGPFFIIGGGGGGGEGGFNSDTNVTAITGLNATVVGGGGGGGFAVTENESVLWEQWSLATGWAPVGVDNAGPDHVIAQH